MTDNRLEECAWEYVVGSVGLSEAEGETSEGARDLFMLYSCPV